MLKEALGPGHHRVARKLAWRLALDFRTTELMEWTCRCKKAHELGNELKLQTLEEKHWTIGSSAHPLETYSLIFITLELDMCHLGVESLTCVEHVWNYLCLVGCL